MLVIYHNDKQCVDGFCSAFLASKVYPGATFHPAHYGDEPPGNILNEDVLILDFSYHLEALKRIKVLAKSLLIIDHHKSAENVIKEFEHIYDVNNSGAKLTYDYLLPLANKEFKLYYKLVDYVEDRDLWNWKLPNSKEINAYLQSLPLTFADFELAAAYVNYPSIISDGKAILQYQDKIIEEMLNYRNEVKIGKWMIPIINSSILQSELGNRLAEGKPFSVVWYKESNKYVYSLRSDEKGLDVSIIAGMYEGGGHLHASGFTAGKFVF